MTALKARKSKAGQMGKARKPPIVLKNSAGEAGQVVQPI
jgi:hypothetical protein